MKCNFFFKKIKIVATSKSSEFPFNKMHKEFHKMMKMLLSSMPAVSETSLPHDIYFFSWVQVRLCVHPFVHPSIQLCSGCNFTSSVISSWNLVEMFSIMSRRVTYKTHDSMSKVKVTMRGKCQNYVIYTLSLL